MTVRHPLPCIAIAGPTASGKTAAALALVERLAARGQKAEIISVDSALVYKGMDIGTAKPTAAELAAAPHHLIDIIDPLQSYSAAEFVRDTQIRVEEIRARNAIPLLVGGTMLYFKALMDGLDDMPAADPAVRAKLDAEAAELGWPAMHAKLAEVDPVTAARLAPADSQRIQRALEVWHVSGKPLSSFHTSNSKTGPAEQMGLAALFSLEPTDRKWLHERIAQRFDLMLEQGFVNEVQQLRARGDLHLDLPSMRCVGYRQAWEVLDAYEADPSKPFDTAGLRERGIIATRQLAKRQITWLRSMPQRHAIACDEADAQQQLLDAAIAAIDQAQQA